MFLIPGIPYEALTSERNGLHGLHQPAYPLSPDLPGHSPAMAGVYRPRHPERPVLYRVLFYHVDRFLAEYESRFERECGFFRPIVKEVVGRYLGCGNPRCGFARIRCPDCGEERLLLDVRQLFTKIDIAARPDVYYQRG